MCRRVCCCRCCSSPVAPTQARRPATAVLAAISRLEPVATAISRKAAPDLTPNNPPNPAGLGPAPVDLGIERQPRRGRQLRPPREDRNHQRHRLGHHRRRRRSQPRRRQLHHRLLDDRRSVERLLDLGLGRRAGEDLRRRLRGADAGQPDHAPSLAMQTAYTDAAGRTPPDHLNLSSGNLGGLTLAPGLYNWGSTRDHPVRRHPRRRRQRRLDLPDLE